MLKRLVSSPGEEGGCEVGHYRRRAGVIREREIIGHDMTELRPGAAGGTCPCARGDWHRPPVVDSIGRLPLPPHARPGTRPLPLPRPPPPRPCRPCCPGQPATTARQPTSPLAVLPSARQKCAHRPRAPLPRSIRPLSQSISCTSQMNVPVRLSLTALTAGRASSCFRPAHPATPFPRARPPRHGASAHLPWRTQPHTGSALFSANAQDASDRHLTRTRTAGGCKLW
ncbi:uncharacterized protein B0H18DRAFT_655052 [Fomitopsis serialis]|uniref:uncharacterized protein n=1 Tax=Fomitopsis serialis TaxID=139415 RepID=UPI002008ACC1|nr:uncharacterized protein B0H18DRAFT_655052 [Neoantrodia serialis]KAH9919103.1 hypothetical protein B0H18DRAFT_655052 [Neoantrodia serialis]